MSKMDNLRAMREARYEQARARGAAATTARPAPSPAGAQASRSAPKRALVAVDNLPDIGTDTDTDTGEALCGHRAISGRTCTREAGHSAKSHRYS
jgi:hypothetical protein